jgi:hypothetical protein
MVTRRTFTSGLVVGAAVAAVGLPVDAVFDPVAAAEGPDPILKGHNLFAVEKLPGMTWVDRTIPHQIKDLSDEMITEVHAALMTESVAEITQGWVRGCYNSARLVALYDYREHNTGKATFVGDVHAVFGEMILDATEKHDTTIIVSPTALAILQSSTTSRFVRRYKDEHDSERIGISGLPHVGNIEHLRILVDAYADHNKPALIGHVPPEPRDRRAAIIRTGVAGVAFGTKPGYDDYTWWKAVGVVGDHLSFI